MNLINILNKYPKSEDSLIQILLDLQASKHTHYVSEEELIRIASYIGVSESKVCGVMSFYTMLSTTPKAKHNIEVCVCVPCYLNDSINVLERIERELGIKVRETTRDNEFSLEFSSCIGCCDESPAMRIDETTYTSLTPEKISKILSSVRGSK